jgi:hypothetical protein
VAQVEHQLALVQLDQIVHLGQVLYHELQQLADQVGVDPVLGQGQT